MILSDSARVLLRRWYLVLLGLALTAGLSVLALRATPPTYTSEAHVLLMPPEESVGEDGNPFLHLNGMGQALDVLTRQASAAEVVDPIAERHPGTGYTITPDVTTSAPVVHVVVTGGDPAEVTAVQTEAVASVVATLATMQDAAELAPELQIGTIDLVVDDEPTENTKARLRLMVVVAGAGAVGTFILAGMLDGVLQRRRARRLGRPDVGDGAAAGDGSGGSDDPDAADDDPDAADGDTPPDPDPANASDGATGPGRRRSSRSRQPEPAAAGSGAPA